LNAKAPPISTRPSTRSGTCPCRRTSSAPTLTPIVRGTRPYSRANRGSVAAPTAGLHFAPETIAALGTRGIGWSPITLHVGYGTFKPVRADRVEDHTVDPERYEVPAACRERDRGGSWSRETRGRDRHHDHART
jgi:hypothetical protein